MVVKYNVIERGNPGNPSEPKKYYASSVVDGEIYLEDLIKEIQRRSTVSGADVSAVIYALTDVTIDALQEGKNVHMGDLGNFRTSISSSGSKHPEEVTDRNIRFAKIIFTPGKKLKQMLKRISFKKIKPKQKPGKT